MSCGQIALNKAGIKYDKYFACEIDKYAISVTQKNYPNTIQLGDVTKVFGKDLPKIDLIIGGSPCQGFSFAGKQLNFEDERSKLFFEFVRLIKECEPKYFLLENVKMKKEYELVISQYLKVAPIQINSALVSAQNRVRLYWTNINEKPYGLFGDMMCDIPQPKDKGILLKDILENEVPKKYFLSENMLNKLIETNGADTVNDNTLIDFSHQNEAIRFYEDKCPTLKQRDYKEPRCVIQLNENNKSNGGTQPYQQDRIYDVNGIAPALMKDKSDLLICHNVQTMVRVRKHKVDIIGLQNLLKKHKNITIKQISQKLHTPKTEVEHWFRTDNCFSIPSSEIWIELKSILQIETNEFDNQIMEFIEKPNEFDQANRAYGVDGKNPTLTATNEGNMIVLGGDYRSDEGYRWRDNGKTPTLTKGAENSGMQYNSLAKIGDKIRRLMPIECERLQTVPDNYTNNVSDTQRYRMLGNGWTVDVIVHILNLLQI